MCDKKNGDTDIPDDECNKTLAYLAKHHQRLADLVEERTSEISALNERYRALLDVMPDLMLWMDIDGNFLDFKGPQDNLLIPVNKIIESKISDLPMGKEYKEDLLELIRKAVETGAMQLYEYYLELPIGPQYYEARIVKSGDNEAVALVRNITKRKYAEEALKESEERFRKMADLLPQCIYELDLEGKITYANQAAFRFFGYTPEELENGLNALDLIAPEERGIALKNIKEAFYGNRLEGKEYYALRKDKTVFPILVYSSAIIRKDNPVGARGIVIDITERKESEAKEKILLQQLTQADKMISLGALVTGVAHEINNPNNAIMLNTPLLRDIFSDMIFLLEERYKKSMDFEIGGIPIAELKETVSQLFKGITRSSERIETIVEDLKNFARPDPLDLNIAVHVNEVLKSSVTLLNNMIQKSTRNFSVEYGANIPKIKGNFQRLEQVVINLLQNACQAIRFKDKAIRVSTALARENTTENVHITVSDEGCGIPGQNLKFITDPFFTTKRDIGCVGFGLSIAARIIKDHGGRLDIESKPGEGSVFTVILPVIRNGDKTNNFGVI